MDVVASLIFEFDLSWEPNGMSWLLSELEVVSLVCHLLWLAMLRQVLRKRVFVKLERSLNVDVLVLLLSLIFGIL